jgi:sec-independent protein translocase protein TatA
VYDYTITEVVRQPVLILRIELRVKSEINMANLVQNALAFGSVGWPEMLVILVIALLIFGKRLPEVARSLGKSLNEFKKGMNETKEDIEKHITADDKEKDEKTDKTEKTV